MSTQQIVRHYPKVRPTTIAKQKPSSQAATPLPQTLLPPTWAEVWAVADEIFNDWRYE